MTSHSSSGKIATSCSWYSLLSFFGSTGIWFQHPLRWLAQQGKRLRMEDAATIYSFGYVAYDMSSVFQRQYCQVAFAPGTPRTLGTPIGQPRYPGFIATPLRFPAPVQVQQVDCRLQWCNRSWPPMLDSRIMDPTVHDSMVAWNLSLLSTEVPTGLRHLNLDRPT